ncbi:MAG TPA: PQQ-dependent dehydrogenase, methanol/ethanol family [Bryobacteraceae bacterium]|jgi:alcohol dehydrogenase (cytochrome c)|nr:PQQ-dependent dehydrogenase, methanol/ethanol family [Bryobacteraceae bacterium]
MKRLLWIFVAAFAANAQVTNDALVHAQQDPDTWLTYGRNYQGWRFSPLAQVTAANVAQLAPAWILPTGVPGNNETTPLVVGGMMYLTGPSNNAWAVDLLTGRKVWSYSDYVPSGLGLCCGTVNRGFAMLGDKLFKVNIQSTLVALDSKTGKVIWETPIDDYRKGYSNTVAPLVVKDMVVVGTAGAEWGIRGYVDAYDANTGKRRWRFYTVPTSGEKGIESWGGNSFKTGGGSTWITGTYDPELNLIYWGVGNPGPDMDGDVRPGDNLYTCAIVAIDADTGKLKWYFQMTPHDVHDWDAVADPVLMDVTVDGKKIKAVGQANRNGFYYLLDRATGRYITAKPYTKINWADGLTAEGRPILIANREPTPEGTLVCPGLGGGHNWNATAYSPQTGLYYFSSTDGCELFDLEKQEYVEGKQYQAGDAFRVPKDPQTGSVVAVDPATGVTKWKHELVSTPSGMLATAGGLVFTGDSDGYFMALDGKTGKTLWHFATGAPIRAPAISYTFRGKQYIAVISGQNLIAFKLP